MFDYFYPKRYQTILIDIDARSTKRYNFTAVNCRSIIIYGKAM